MKRARLLALALIFWPAPTAIVEAWPDSPAVVQALGEHEAQASALGLKQGGGIPTPATILPTGTILEWWPAWAGITLASGTVVGWTGQIAGQTLTATGVTAPNYTVGGPGTAAVCFTGASAQTIFGGSVTKSQPYEVIVITKVTTLAPSINLYAVSVALLNTQILETTAGKASSDTGAQLIGPSIGTTTSYVAIDSILNGASSSLAINNGTATTGNAGSTGLSSSVITVGNASNTSFSNAWPGCIGDVLLINGKLTTAQRTQLFSQYYIPNWPGT